MQDTKDIMLADTVSLILHKRILVLVRRLLESYLLGTVQVRIEQTKVYTYYVSGKTSPCVRPDAYRRCSSLAGMAKKGLIHNIMNPCQHSHVWSQ